MKDFGNEKVWRRIHRLSQELLRERPKWHALYFSSRFYTLLSHYLGQSRPVMFTVMYWVLMSIYLTWLSIWWIVFNLLIRRLILSFYIFRIGFLPKKQSWCLISKYTLGGFHHWERELILSLERINILLLIVLYYLFGYIWHFYWH